jgi:Flp pilus assembly protein TadD
VPGAEQVTYARVVPAISPPPSTPSEPETTPEEYRQRALLLADLGRYDEAAGEIAAGLGAAPADAALLATLARVHLAADQPAEALVAAEKAVTAAPDTINPLVVRAMALADSSRFADAARVATGILRRWPEDPYAQRTGAALLSEARNGQEALNAAWHGVRVAPDEAEAHLVLAVVSARLRLFDLAQRAYAEALELDAAIGDAQADVGIVRLERRRWAKALEDLADSATPELPPQAAPPADGPYPSPLPRPYRMPDDDGPDPDGPDREGVVPDDPGEDSAGRSSRFSPSSSSGRRGGSRADRGRRASDRGRNAGARGGAAAAPGERGWFEPPVVVRPSGPVLDPSEDSAAGIRQAVAYGANGTLVAAVLTAGMTIASSGASRVWAGMIGVLILLALLIWLSRRLIEPVPRALSRLRSTDLRLAIAAWMTVLAPVVFISYAFIGGPIPLVAAMVVAAAAELLILIRRR